MSYIIGTNTNVKATITIYKRCILNPEKNFALDNGATGRSIENYLSTLESQVVNNVNYQKQGLYIDLKLDRNQSGLEMGEDDKDWNYMKIQNGSEKPLYYFITNKEWLAKDTIKFSLTMDTLNSFEFNVDYEINKKTNIIRQHKDRLKDTGILFTEKYDDPSVYLARGANFDHSFMGVGATIPWSIGLPPTYPQPYPFNPIEGIDEYFAVVVYQKPGFPTLIVPQEYYETRILERDGRQVFFVRFIQEFDAGEDYDDCFTYAYLLPKVNLLYKDIDLYSEGINAPVYKKELGKLIDKGGNVTWYLLYRNTQQQDPTEYVNNSPVECFLIPENSIKIKAPLGFTITSSSLGDTYAMATDLNQKFDIDGQVFQGSAGLEWVNVQDDVQKFFWTYVIFKKNGANLDWYYYKYTAQVKISTDAIIFGNRELLNSGSVAYVTVLPNPVFDDVKVYESSTDPYDHFDYHDFFSPTPLYNASIQSSGYTEVSLNNVSLVDRTDSRNIKLLALPYCPSTFTPDNNGVLSITDDWSYDSTTKWLKCNNLAQGFKNELQVIGFNPFLKKFISALGIQPNNERNDEFESKLLHSDYYRYKFVYDSFSRIYELEKYDFTSFIENYPNYYPNMVYPENPITFVATRTINSKFVFLFNDEYIVNSNLDYDGVCCVSRNNEEPLFNSAYINYVKAGYNYDKKSLERTNEANVLGIGLSIGSALIGVLGSVATWNPIPALVGLAGAGIGIASQIANTIRTTAQGEQAIQQKLDETSRQAVSVAGSDDIDLLTAYSDNRAKFVEYDISARMKKCIGDLFYYCGYKTDLQGIPNKSSRYWFNYVQAELVINDTSNLPSDIEEDIKTRFSTGVTFFHYHNGYDFAQEKENVEVALL